MRHALQLSLLCMLFCGAYGQQTPTGFDQALNYPTTLFSKVCKQSAALDDRLTRQTKKYLARLARKEDRLRRQLYAIDSTKAAALFTSNSSEQYNRLEQQLLYDSTRPVHSMGPEYLPYVDSLQGALSFFQKNAALLNATPALQTKIQASLMQYQQLQAKLQDADAIKQFIQNRKAQFQQYLGQYEHLPAGITKSLQQYSKQGFYYADQVRAYRETLNDPDKLLQTTLAMLNKLPVFSDFMKTHSFLAGLFTVPVNYGSSEGVIGLQTRDQVLSLMQTQLAGGGANASTALQQSLQTARQDMDKLHDKLNALGGGSGDIDMPHFTPNSQHRKTFLKRLELGTDLQTTNNSYYFPTTTDIGLSLGYRLNDRLIVGIGGSGKIGWGNGWGHIKMSGQGASIRSFLDCRLHGSFFISSGFEYNYQQPFSSLQQVRDLHNWSQSGLLGISKTVSLKSRVFKKTKVSALWDYLSYSQRPPTPAFKFRLGYTF